MKIPNNELPKEYKNHNYIDSKLIEIDSSSGIIIDLQYPKLGLKNSINKCLVREEVYDMLLKAKEYLPNNITFKIWDSYRPFALQEELYYKYKKRIIRDFNLEKLSKYEQDEIINNYVVVPKRDKYSPPPHTTGGAVDLTLTNTFTGKDLNLGVDFDSFSDKSHTSYYEENDISDEIRNNRRILYNAMTKAGFTNLPTEYWHYDYGNRNWAYYKKKDAIYSEVEI